METKEHLEILQQGIAIWNAWRQKHPSETIDLSRADLLDIDLSGANLSNVDLNSVFLSGANLTRANLSGADLSGADLSVANLSGADLLDSNLNNADLSGANLLDADLSRALLSRANLSNARLTGADLSRANLSGADLSDSNLSRADLSRADLSRADLSRAIIGLTTFGDLDFRTVKGLETIQHIAPSTIGTDTLERSEGNIPEIFLRGAGLSETFLTYARSLVQSPIQYYTCFISHSSKNQDFVERLYADLQNKGVRCWYAPEDLKIGKSFPEQIEEAIRLYDKLIVILSEHSVGSSWVEDEVRAAQEKEERFKREQQLTKTVLFPIKIDTTIDQATVQWAARLRRQQHIGNFINWKHYDTYQKAFQRLLRDLQEAPTKDE